MPTDDPRPKRSAPEPAATPDYPVPPGVDPEYAKYWDPALHEAARKKRRNFMRLAKAMAKKYPPPKDPKAHARLVQHRFLYDKFGLPK